MTQQLDRNSRAATPVAAPRAGLVVAALLVVYVVWGSTYLGIRVVVEEAPPLSGMGVRFLAAGVVLGVILKLRGRRIAVTRRQLAGAATLGALLPLGGNGLVAVGENMGAPSGVAALLVASIPLWVILLRLVGGDRVRPLTVVGVVVGFLGLCYLVLAGNDDAGAASFPLLSAGVIVLASVLWSVGSYIQPRLPLPEDVFVTTVWEMVTGGAMMVAVGLLAGERLPREYDASTLFAWGYLVLFGSVLAFTAYVWLLANAPVSLVATYAYVNPVVAVVLGWAILSEPITGAIVVGGGIVVAGVAVVIGAERRQQ